MCKKTQRDQKKPFPAGFHCVLTAWFSWVGTIGQPDQTSPDHSCLSLKSPRVPLPCSGLQLWKFVTGSKWFWRREKTGTERSLSSESLLNHASFLGRSHIYMTNSHVAVTVAEYFQESGIINVLAAWDCFFPDCKCCSICHKPIGSNSLAFPVKGASQHTMFVAGTRGQEVVPVCDTALLCPAGQELALRKQASRGRSSLLFTTVWTVKLLVFDTIYVLVTPLA